MKTAFAPLALFVYRRTRHLSAALDALERCPEFAASPVYVFSDGPRSDAEADQVRAVRALLAARRRPNMIVVEAPQNRGLANSIIAGVTQLCQQYGRVIVIEDDLVASPKLLSWFNAALDRYGKENQIWQVSGHQFAVPQFCERQQAMLLNFSTSWGWATWARAWQGFDPGAEGWDALAQDVALRRRFDLNGAYPYAEMLELQMAGRVDSWAIRWWWSMFQAGALGLFPPRPLVANIGDDDTATHASSRLFRIFNLRQKGQIMNTMPDFPDAVLPDVSAQRTLEAFLRKKSGKSRWVRALMAQFK